MTKMFGITDSVNRKIEAPYVPIAQYMNIPMVMLNMKENNVPVVVDVIGDKIVFSRREEN